ncbi:GNAT family N-acetyltransferase [Streptomyces montanisoli]|uniref:GNAT family N-acetyltransferase n=1 Tax=Streptomyces montanisoli TaxID=2798581 RepID=A0A940RZ65_9ACTN|nr:GNAT family N-acetyltransferase [Streptomyces montanisoli]MBP0459444.1 GNAT family N-acetyltransferase [Streptomyces montanisoli]
MSTPLAEVPIRPLTLRDLASCAELAADRGWPPDEHKWRLLLTAGTGYGIDDPNGTGLAAVCVVTRYGTPGAGHAGELSVIGMMLVATHHERQGLGQRLMRHAMREAGNTPLALYATRFGQPLYERLGFTVIGQNVKVRGRLLSPPPQDRLSPEGITVRTATAEDLPAIVRLDTEVFGVDRTLMITRFPAFAEQLRVAVDGSDVVGYAATWASTDADVIGPLIARDAPTAKALIASLASSTDRPLRTDIDARHEGLLAWLKEHGLDVVVTSAVMVHGTDDLPCDRGRRFAPLTMATL